VNKPLGERRSKVDQGHSHLSITRQCDVLQIHRSGIYYKPIGESEFNLKLMRMIDEQHMLRPWYGVPRMTDWLRLDKGLKVNHKRIERLYRLLGIQAIGPKPNTSKPGKGHKIYPYLLRKLKVNRPNHVWAMDFTYIPIQGGYLYLVAVIDLYSRYVVNWSLSNTMTAEWCRDTLDEAIERYGPPDIVNTDQGSQFTSEIFSKYVVSKRELKLSMDGKGRAIDNIFIERLWRSVKYEHVYVYPAADGLESYQGLRKYFEYYNNERRHSSLKKQTPVSVYKQKLKNVA
jgi:putative transposase